MAKNVELSDRLYAKLERLSKEAEVTPTKYIHMLLNSTAKGSTMTEVSGLFPSYSTSQ